VEPSLANEDVARFVSRVTSMMCGLTFAPASALGEASSGETWRVAILPMPGLRVALSSDRGGCASIAASMLGMETDDLDLAMIDDALRELANMTAGQLKAQLALDTNLGLPSVGDADALAGPAWTHYPLVGSLLTSSIRLVVSISTK
jgi:hypothetical protein